MALVERQGGEVVHGGFQAHGAGSGGSQTFFRNLQQQRPHTQSARRRNYVNGNDVCRRAAMHHDEAGRFSCLPWFFFRNQRKRPPVVNVGLQFLLRIRDSRGKAFLVHTPQGLEVFKLEVADDDGHADIVAGETYRARPKAPENPAPRPAGRFFPQAAESFPEKNLPWGRLSPCPDRNFGRTISIRKIEEDVVERLLFDVVGAVVVLGAWYFLFSLYNRRKGTEALSWVQSACAGKGRILDSRWLSSYRLHARLQFPSRSFENAHVTMKFRPRATPVQWLLSCYHKQKETLTFEADLGGSPSFHLEVVRHRWCAHSRGVTNRRRDEREWDVYEPGPVILTTRTHWKQDSTPELNTLMTVRQQDVLQVSFRPESPQFSATIALDALDDPRTAAGFLTTLRELAAGASAHRQ